MSFLKNVKPNKPVASLEGYLMAMLAKSKFGKTTWAVDVVREQYDGDMSKALLLATEIGYKTMADVYAIPVTTFDKVPKDEENEEKEEKGFIEVVDELIENKNDVPFRFIIIDTITALERYAIAYAIKKANREDRPQKRYTDISDIAWGKGYNLVAEYIYEQIDRLKKAGFGVLIIGHEKTKSVELNNGFKYDYTTFNVLGKTCDIIVREADMIIYGDLIVSKGADGEPVEERKLRFRSDGNVLCGTRFRNFPEVIDNDAKVFLAEFKKAVLGLYNNDEKAVATAKVEQEEKAEEKAQKAIEKEKELNKVDSLKEEIMSVVKSLNKEAGEKVKVAFNKVFGTPDFRTSDDEEKLTRALEYVKSLA